MCTSSWLAAEMRRVGTEALEAEPAVEFAGTAEVGYNALLSALEHHVFDIFQGMA